MSLKKLLYWILFWGCLFSIGTAWCETEGSHEYALKAAFLYNFTQFTEWPSSVGTTLKVCVYGKDPFGENLDILKGKTVGGRSIMVQRSNRLADLKDCQVVFISAGAIGQLSDIQETIKGRPVLTIADSPTAAKRGVAINMFTALNKITFEVNLAAARNVGLNLSSKLLQLSSKVYQ